MLRKNKTHHPKVSNNSRLVRRDGNKNQIKRSGIKRISRNDFYVNTLSSSWLRLIVAIVLIYIFMNSVFASLYLMQPGSIENAKPGSFFDAFFFSVQTLATIGYGKMAPATNFSNILVTIEALMGLSGLAIATGVIFTKISQPKPRILFGNYGLFSSHYKNMNCFMFRLGNLRTSQIADPIVKAVLICDEPAQDGTIRRAFHDLKLTRSNMPMLMPSWTVKHHINEESPLFKATTESMREKNVEIIVSVIGFDETLSQTVHAHHSYIADEIKFGKNFVDIITWDQKGDAHVNYKRFHDIVA